LGVFTAQLLIQVAESRSWPGRSSLSSVSAWGFAPDRQTWGVLGVPPPESTWGLLGTSCVRRHDTDKGRFMLTW